MAGARFLDVLGKVGYSARTMELDLQGDRIFVSLSNPAKAFLYDALDLTPGEGIRVGQLFGRRWTDDAALMRQFKAMPESASTEVLGFVGLIVHEFTHHLDFLTTPFGLNFHSKTIREYWSMQDFAPVLLENPELIPERLIDFETHFAAVQRAGRDNVEIPWYSMRAWDSLELKTYWENLRGQVLTFEAWGDASTIRPLGYQIEPGLLGEPNSITIFGQKFEVVTVNSFFTSIRPNGVNNWYLRHLTILETRAVANSLNWHLSLLGDAGLPDVHRFFVDVYGHEDLPRDYLFLFDLIARGFGSESFAALLAKGAIGAIREALSMLITSCWYALQAPPPMDQMSLLASSSIVRLLVILQTFDDIRAGRRKGGFASFVDLAGEVDQSEQAMKMHFRPIGEIMPFCRALTEKLAAMNEEKTWNPEVRSHFGRVLSLLAGSLGRRDGYASLSGMPAEGNPVLGLDEDDVALLEPYEPPAGVREWFTFRRDALFVFRPRSWTIDKLETHFGMHELTIPCTCGLIISGRISRFKEGMISVKCPQCERIHNVDIDDIFKINVGKTPKRQIGNS